MVFHIILMDNPLTVCYTYAYKNCAVVQDLKYIVDLDHSPKIVGLSVLHYLFAHLQHEEQIEGDDGQCGPGTANEWQLDRIFRNEQGSIENICHS